MMDYEPKYGLIGKAMDVLMMRRMMNKNLGDALRGLEEYLKTGKDIPKGWKPSRAN